MDCNINIDKIKKHIKKQKSIKGKQKLLECFDQYIFSYIDNIQTIKDTVSIKNNLQKTKRVITKQCELENQKFQYHILSFEHTIIFIKNMSIKFLDVLLEINQNLSFLYLSDPNNLINYTEKNNYSIIESHPQFNDEISNFSKRYSFIEESAIKANRPIFQNIIKCIAAYLIKKSYEKLNIDRNNEIKPKESQDEMLTEICENDYIFLRNVGEGSSFLVSLNYHIKKEKLFVIKAPLNDYNVENKKLFIRMCTNCPKINHQFLPKFYGSIKGTGKIAMEFIYGETLSSVNLNSFTECEIYRIILQLIIALQYIHGNKFVLRDLNPNNIIIDQNKNAIIIDFDRMINHDDIQNNENTTNDFSILITPQEVNTGNFSYECDVYSLGYIMKYITDKVNLTLNYSEIRQIYKYCLDTNPKNRPSISELCEKFSNICNIIKSANQNNSDAQFRLGAFYYEGKYFSQDINKSIHYFTLAANQNDSVALCNLGVIYYEGKYIPRDIKKSIHYLSLAADLNNSDAQYYIGIIYHEGKYIPRDIKKSIHYLSLAANLNNSDAQFYLGINYYNGNYFPHDIHKAIHYLSLASNQNNTQAQFNLGAIFYEAKYCPLNIEKSIHYLSLAANQGHSMAQCDLGVIYLKYCIPRDVVKSIHYFTLAAMQNFPNAQYYLSLTYLHETIAEQNIRKGLDFLFMASDKGLRLANFSLGYIYHEGKYVKHDDIKCLRLYIDASNFQIEFAKNNIGILHKIGFGEIFTPNPRNGEVYFNEAIKQADDKVSMYNLAHTYYFDMESKCLDKSIQLLVRSSQQNFCPSMIFLSLLLIKKYFFNFNEMKQEISKYDEKCGILSKIIYIIFELDLYNNFGIYFEKIKKNCYLYNHLIEPISIVDFNEQKEKRNQHENSNIPNIDMNFYEGFGFDLYQKH